ncbi:hypothetical protein, partial [Methanosarcina sp. 2.H.T.1A.15]|uniref:hypothetical protein n=1 Tax=Methanosarcina sp. 2.H.T.1A.15 TaxID=1483596 RepID=UPI00064F58DB
YCTIPPTVYISFDLSTGLSPKRNYLIILLQLFLVLALVWFSENLLSDMEEASLFNIKLKMFRKKSKYPLPDLLQRF